MLSSLLCNGTPQLHLLMRHLLTGLAEPFRWHMICGAFVFHVLCLSIKPSLKPLKEEHYRNLNASHIKSLDHNRFEQHNSIRDFFIIKTADTTSLVRTKVILLVTNQSSLQCLAAQHTVSRVSKLFNAEFMCILSHDYLTVRIWI